MRKIILPPIVTVLCLLGIYMLRKFISLTEMHLGNIENAGYAIAAIGVALPLWGSHVFKQAQTNILPYNDPDNIVTDGPFRFSRNPMYLGMLLILLGVFVKVGYWENIIFPVIFFAVANWWYIPFEESRMRAAFGDTFDTYTQKVRRWI
ncbi:methyltransferase family protein [Kordiimonas aquimaris]|uniref:methyltransferase family protein n=1 Tax=Kordiimonas aquimaris TaxID=707591 RepID=UPI0021D271F0|nr:isoprenylcysteine carboxylmethyltransferase family protein [Kordiimonas aquimaris]